MNSGAWVTFSSGSSANEMVLCPHLVWDVPPQLASVEPPPQHTLMDPELSLDAVKLTIRINCHPHPQTRRQE